MKHYAIGLMALLSCVYAFAQTSASNPVTEKDACSVDIKQFCGDITPGQGRVGACLKAHDDKLSGGCRNLLTQVRHTMRDLRTACQSDMQRFCNDTKMGAGRIIDCLQAHQNDLSASCKTETQSLGSRGTASVPSDKH